MTTIIVPPTSEPPLDADLSGLDPADVLATSRNADGTYTVTLRPGASIPGRLSRLAYSLLYTMEERVDIRAAAKTDPIVEDICDLLALAQDVDLSHPATVQGVQYLEAQGIIAEGRAAQVLSGEPPS